MTDLEEAKLAILSNPDDDAPRLAYASLIEEKEPLRSEFIRLQLELASHGLDPFCPSCEARNRFNYTSISNSCHDCREFADLKERETNLLMFDWTNWSKACSSPNGYQCWNINNDETKLTKITFSRGFVRDIRITFDEWLKLTSRIFCAAEWYRTLFTRPKASAAASKRLELSQPIRTVSFDDERLPTLYRVRDEQFFVLGRCFRRVQSSEWACDDWPGVKFLLSEKQIREFNSSY